MSTIQHNLGVNKFTYNRIRLRLPDKTEYVDKLKRTRRSNLRISTAIRDCDIDITTS
jgi:hypothetical protein